MASKQKKGKPFTLSLISLVLMVLGVGFIMLGRNPYIISATFETEPVITNELQNDVEKVDLIPEKIIIPSLSLDLSVKSARRVSGYWEVFEEGAGWGEGSGLPGMPGNQVIFAHARPHLFGSLKEIKKDDAVYVFTKNNWYGYKVIEIKSVYPNQTEVIKPTETEILTLYTCSGFNDSKRLIIVAERK